jgi:type VI secretion system protein ImpF
MQPHAPSFHSADPAHPGARSLRASHAVPTRVNAHLWPTLFDRLRDDAPGRTSELPSDYTVTPAQMRDIIRRALLDYEPRLIPQTLSVVPLMKEEGAAQGCNVLLFEIRALIDLRPYPLEFTVQSAVDLETNRMSVLRAAR